MYDDVDRLRDVALDRGVGQLAGARQEKLEPGERARGGACVKGRERALVAGAQRLEERRGLARRADFADEDPIGTHAQCVRDQIRDADRDTIPPRHALEVNDMRMRENELVRVLDDDKPLLARDRRGQRP